MQPTTGLPRVRFGSPDGAFQPPQTTRGERVEQTVRFIGSLIQSFNQTQESEDTTEPSDKRSISPLDAPQVNDHESARLLAEFITNVVIEAELKEKVSEKLDAISQKIIPKFPLSLVSNRSFTKHHLELSHKPGTHKNFYFSNLNLSLQTEKTKLAGVMEDDGVLKEYLVKPLNTADEEAQKQLRIDLQASDLGLISKSYVAQEDAGSYLLKKLNSISLSKFLEEKQLSIDEAFIFLSKMVDLVSKLQDQMGVAHRNISMEAFEVKQKEGRFIPLFAGLEKISAEARCNDYVGDKSYVAPEVFFKKLNPKSRHTYDPKLADNYALGVVFFNLLTGKDFEECFDKIAYSERFSYSYRDALFNDSLDEFCRTIEPIVHITLRKHLTNLPKKFLNVITGLVKVDPTKRISLVDARLVLLNP